MATKTPVNRKAKALKREQAVAPVKIEDMGKDELVVAFKAVVKELQDLKQTFAEVQAVAAAVNAPQLPAKKRWAVYGRCST